MNEPFFEFLLKILENLRENHFSFRLTQRKPQRKKSATSSVKIMNCKHLYLLEFLI